MTSRSHNEKSTTLFERLGYAGVMLFFGAIVGSIAGITAYAMWTRLLKRHPANRVAPFSLGVPVVGITAGMLILGEQITNWQWGGISLIVAALLLVMFGSRIKGL
jgi:O-acetylserine/cysteine efflux transporter